MNIDNVFEFLWKDFVKEAPAIANIKALFENNGETVENDHIAFRTLKVDGIEKEVLAKPFLALGYEIIDTYHFAEKNLDALHLEYKGEGYYPRVFISELLLDRFNNEFNTIINNEIVNNISNDMLNGDNLILSGRVWGLPSYEVYQTLRKDSEYAAWFYLFGFRANHFTVSVNRLNNFDSIEAVNTFLKESGFPLNTSGGEVKGTKEVFLKQSSTVAESSMLAFREGVYTVPSCFYEFAERFEMENGELFSGFIADNANKIFESTDLEMLEKTATLA